jgi:hypothetical protein
LKTKVQNKQKKALKNRVTILFDRWRRDRYGCAEAMHPEYGVRRGLCVSKHLLPAFRLYWADFGAKKVQYLQLLGSV